MYKKYIEQLEEAGKIRNLKDRSANSHFLRTSGPYSTDSQEHAPDTNYYAAKGSLHE